MVVARWPQWMRETWHLLRANSVRGGCVAQQIANAATKSWLFVIQAQVEPELP